MQVVSPIDIEDALRIDLSALIDDVRFFCLPIPSDLGVNDVLIRPLGGARVSHASDEYDVSVECYAEDDETAHDLANAVNGIIASLPLRETSTQYNDAYVMKPHQDFDPRAPQLSRYSFRATVICPGNRINF